MKYDELISQIPAEQAELVTPLHGAALAKACRCRVDRADDATSIAYSAQRYSIHIANASVSFEGDYDIRAFIGLYNETDDPMVRELLFHGADSCSYCIDDKCTTLLMAKQRTIRLGARTKKLCGPYRHHLHLSVDAANLPACIDIASMMFAHAYDYPARHRDLDDRPDRIEYRMIAKPTFYIVGYVHKHRQLSPTDEDFVASMLGRDRDGSRRIDSLLEALGHQDDGQYVGATDNFVNGTSYDFFFGVLTASRPGALPEGAICRRVRDGEWAVYNSSQKNYRNIWRHYTQSFYGAEHKGYDRARIPFEYYDATGSFYDVHIPVDADMPADSGQVTTLLHMPDVLLAGYLNYAETDHPQYRDRPFDECTRVTELFPHADNLVRVSVHSLFGKPLVGFDGVVVDDYTMIPDGVEFYRLKGGYWHLLGWRHFNGKVGDWGEALRIRFDSVMPLDNLNHPRGFNQYVYRARGGYDEIGIPVRAVGKRTYEVVDLAPQRIMGKLESPPESVVTEADKQRFYTMPENVERGCYLIGFTETRVPSGRVYYDRPLAKGVLVEPGAPAPEGLSELTLDGGRYVRVTEDIPNGELGWEAGGILAEIQEQTGNTPASERQFIYKQCAFGGHYELYVPVTGPPTVPDESERQQE